MDLWLGFWKWCLRFRTGVLDRALGFWTVVYRIWTWGLGFTLGLDVLNWNVGMGVWIGFGDGVSDGSIRVADLSVALGLQIGGWDWGLRLDFHTRLMCGSSFIMYTLGDIFTF